MLSVIGRAYSKAHQVLQLIVLEGQDSVISAH